MGTTMSGYKSEVSQNSQMSLTQRLFWLETGLIWNTIRGVLQQTSARDGNTSTAIVLEVEDQKLITMNTVPLSAQSRTRR